MEKVLQGSAWHPTSHLKKSRDSGESWLQRSPVYNTKYSIDYNVIIIAFGLHWRSYASHLSWWLETNVKCSVTLFPTAEWRLSHLSWRNRSSMESEMYFSSAKTIAQLFGHTYSKHYCLDRTLRWDAIPGQIALQNQTEIVGLMSLCAPQIWKAFAGGKKTGSLKHYFVGEDSQFGAFSWIKKIKRLHCGLVGEWNTGRSLAQVCPL